MTRINLNSFRNLIIVPQTPSPNHVKEVNYKLPFFYVCVLGGEIVLKISVYKKDSQRSIHNDVYNHPNIVKEGKSLFNTANKFVLINIV